MKIKPVLSARQQLKLSPRLYQSLKVLRLDAAGLQELIQREIDENPVLEIPEPADFDMGRAPSRELWRDYLAVQPPSSQGRRPQRAPLNPAELAANPVTLADHLTLQLDLKELPPAKRRLGLALIGSLDSDGYLRDSVSDIARSLSRPVAAVRQVLKVIQEFDPHGVAARNLEECLQIQLRQLGAGRTALKIAEKHLQQVARGATGEIARELGVPPARVEKAVALIRSLNPSPGSIFDASPPAAAVIPDVFVESRQGSVRALANRELLPPLRTSPMYKKMAASSGEAAIRDYIKLKLKNANQLIRDINRRRATVVKVARAIAEAQPGFFEQGPGCLRPLSLEDIATSLDVHPSTISRAILGKYMSTPFGIFELRYFFSSGYATAGGGLAASAIKKQISNMIAGEDSRRPLSDQQLAELLKKDQISISRRTVAKYRQQAAIPPASQRRRR